LSCFSAAIGTPRRAGIAFGFSLRSGLSRVRVFGSTASAPIAPMVVRQLTRSDSDRLDCFLGEADHFGWRKRGMIPHARAAVRRGTLMVIGRRRFVPHWSGP
jgi:hypothetical protein